jgi:hypothetical protein
VQRPGERGERGVELGGVGPAVAIAVERTGDERGECR